MSSTHSKALRPKPAAEYLGIGLSTLWAWAKTRDDFPQADSARAARHRF